VHVGVFSYNTEYGIRVDDLARATEERGFESLWASEHSHIPAGSNMPYAGSGDLSKATFHVGDPFVSLAVAATVTTKIKLGTAVCLVTEHDPITLAKTVATLDYLSNGRLLFGVGGGWNREEVANHGVPFKSRWKIVRERVAAMKAIWTEDEASYHGEFVNFDRIISYPKPVQKPFPPVIMGSANEFARKRAAKYCDGWLPVDMRFEDLAAAVDDLHEKLREEGRDPEGYPVTVLCADGDTTPDTLRRYRDMGMTRAVFMAGDQDRDTVLKRLDTFVDVAAEIA
jgi:probable F420-dependent oxidoreductase